MRTADIGLRRTEINLHDDVEKAQDRAWFKANRRRRFRIRLATLDEARVSELIVRHPDEIILTMVLRLGPGLRVRRFVLAHRAAAHLPAKIAEETARAWWREAWA